MVLNTTLDGKVIKLSEELAREISANQHTNKPFRTKISKEDQTIDVMIWMRDERNVSRIRFDWFDKERSQNQYCLAFSDFCAEVVVINAIESHELHCIVNSTVGCNYVVKNVNCCSKNN